MSAITALNTNSQFKRVYNRGLSVVDYAMVLYVKPNGSKINRLGITVTKKLGGAVVRNRAKRRLKEVYRLSEHLLKDGYDIVLVARMKTNALPFVSLQKTFMRLAQKANITKG